MKDLENKIKALGKELQKENAELKAQLHSKQLLIDDFKAISEDVLTPQAMIDFEKLVKPLKWEDVGKVKGRQTWRAWITKDMYLEIRKICDYFLSLEHKNCGLGVLVRAERINTPQEAKDYAQEWLVDFVRSACKGGIGE